ncbi:NAD-dependent epimerase/dehydratase family protein [Streptomyces sp. ACA25]|uniref:NAD-dependent epimerase/dehydratase family protein n=1 Tax=Streptomyces sp. ACA25 TaxID=3022596 RepID=UPI00230772C4|nr:NAD-dependent epimerase/dehydratase family protein [Streptomyces sp. ACA25]MDB1089177.1 NAD-dependent epimerase/dehydratase family protein [Streptomyces sp. ACA25]
MRLLVLGGTEFVGRSIAEEALRRGWAVTVFNRGRREPPPGATVLTGDRTAPDGLAALGAGEWDLVVDTWAEAPRAVHDAMRLLARRARHCTYMSSRSVYSFPVPAGADEDSPVVEGAPDAGAREYPQNKRGGELAALAAFGERALLVRAGAILGPHENSGRLPWWLSRIARGGRVLAPGPRELGLQYIDVRDLAVWTLDAAAAGLGGPYDLVSPSGHTTMAELLEACAEVTGSGADLRWAGPDAVLAAGIEPWTGLPLWTPPGALHDSLHRSDVARALGAGLRCRPVTETVADTWAWLREEGDRHPMTPDGPVSRATPEQENRALGG